MFSYHVDTFMYKNTLKPAFCSHTGLSSIEIYRLGMETLFNCALIDVQIEIISVISKREGNATGRGYSWRVWGSIGGGGGGTWVTI